MKHTLTMIALMPRVIFRMCNANPFHYASNLSMLRCASPRTRFVLFLIIRCIDDEGFLAVWRMSTCNFGIGKRSSSKIFRNKACLRFVLDYYSISPFLLLHENNGNDRQSETRRGAAQVLIDGPEVTRLVGMGR